MCIIYNTPFEKKGRGKLKEHWAVDEEYCFTNESETVTK